MVEIDPRPQTTQPAREQAARVPNVLVMATVSKTPHAFLLGQVRAMQDLGWSVSIATGSPATPPMLETGAPFHLLTLSRSPRQLGAHLRGVRELRRLLIRERFHVIYVHTPIAAALARFVARTVPRAQRPAVVYFAHGFHFMAPHQRDLVEWGWYFVERSLSRLTDRLIVINSTDFASVARWRIAREGRVDQLLGIGIDPEQFDLHPDAALPEPLAHGGPPGVERWVACVSEFVPRKRHGLLLEAMTLLPESVGLLLLGDGDYEDAVRQQVEELGLADRVLFLGFLQDVRPVLAIADVVALMSDLEGLPRSLMEALCMGVPIAVTDTRGSVDLARAAGCPVATDDTPTAVAKALRVALDDPRSREEVRAAFLASWAEGLDKPIEDRVLEILADAAHRSLDAVR